MYMEVIYANDWNPQLKKEDMLTEMKGLTFSKVENKGDELVFTTDEGIRYVFYHSQDCCEEVYIEDITGDLKDLVGSPLLIAEETSSDVNPVGVPVPEYQEDFLWTFYKFATIKGYVDDKRRAKVVKEQQRSELARKAARRAALEELLA